MRNEGGRAGEPQIGPVRKAWDRLSSSRTARHLGGLAVSAGILYLAVRGSSWREVWRSLSTADKPLLVGAMGTVMLASLLRALRWRRLFAPHQAGLHPRRAWEIILVGQALNIAVPARLGEIARIFLAAEAAGRPKMAVVPTIALEKLLDGIAFLVILAATSTLMVLPPWLARARGGFALSTLAALAVAFITAAYRERLGQLLERLSIPGFLGGRAMAGRLRTAIDGLNSLTSPVAFAVLTLESLLVWSTGALANHLVLRSLGIQAPPIAAFFLLIVLQLGTAPPSTPGKVGVFQYLCLLGLAPFGVARDAAVSYGLLLHVVAYAPPLAAGSLLLVRELHRLRASRVAPAGSLWGSGSPADVSESAAAPKPSEAGSAPDPERGA